MAGRPLKRSGELTGRHVLFGFIAFFGVIFAVNIVFLIFATRTFPGLATDEPFKRGLAKDFNATLEAKALQAERGWQAGLSYGLHEAGLQETGLQEDAKRAHITLIMQDADGRPLSGLDITGALRRGGVSEDSPLTFAGTGSGTYEAPVPRLAPGAWTVAIETSFWDGVPFTAERELWIE